MVGYKREYLQHFSHGLQDFVGCEECGCRATDIHHLTPRSLGGENTVDNLMALCRTHHETAHASKQYNEQLRQKHINYLFEFEQSGLRTDGRLTK